MTDRTYQAWRELRELEPTPRAKRRCARRITVGAILYAATLGYLLAVAPLLALVTLVLGAVIVTQL